VILELSRLKCSVIESQIYHYQRSYKIIRDSSDIKPGSQCPKAYTSLTLNILRQRQH